MNALGVCNEFNQIYNRLPGTDQMFLEGDKVLYFIKAMYMKYWRELGILLEDETQPNGLIADWVVVRRTYDRFVKCCWWLDDSNMAGSIVQGWVDVKAERVIQKSDGGQRRRDRDNYGWHVNGGWRACLDFLHASSRDLGNCIFELM